MTGLFSRINKIEYKKCNTKYAMARCAGKARSMANGMSLGGGNARLLKRSKQIKHAIGIAKRKIQKTEIPRRWYNK
jgi:hypothetical protein